MQIIRNPKRMQQTAISFKKKGCSVGFVATMGALHEGHLSLIRQAKKDNDLVIVSIFVNPAQFGPKEDIKKYPRTLKQDELLCKKAGVDFIFNPQVVDIYPVDFKTFVSVEQLSDLLCGAFRPGHFRGVTTIVAKLFNIVQPDIAYFGQKDAQQCVIIKRIAEDLNFPVKIKVMPIIREKDGLAISSRNVYLSNKDRQNALILSKALDLSRNLINSGVKRAEYIIKRMKALVQNIETAKIDYVVIINPENLEPVELIKGKVLIALAVRIGKTRLIDNIIV